MSFMLDNVFLSVSDFFGVIIILWFVRECLQEIHGKVCVIYNLV